MPAVLLFCIGSFVSRGHNSNGAFLPLSQKIKTTYSEWCWRSSFSGAHRSSLHSEQKHENCHFGYATQKRKAELGKVQSERRKMRCRSQLLFACVVGLLLAISLCGVLEQAHLSHAPTTRYSSPQTKLAEKVLMIDEQQKTHIKNEEPLLSTSRIKTIHCLREVCDRQGEHLFLTNTDGSLKHNMNVRCVKMNPSQHACSCHLCSKKVNSAANHLGRCMHRRRRFRTGVMLAGHVSCDYYQTSEKTVASQEAKKGVLDCLSIVSIVIMTQLSAHEGLKKKLKLMLGAFVSGNSVDDVRKGVRKNTFFETEQKPRMLVNVKETVSKCIRNLYGDFPVTHPLFFCNKNLTSCERPSKDRSGCDYFYSNHGSAESLLGKRYFGLTSFSVLQPPQHVYTVAPATVNTAFLPRRDDDMKSSMAYEGCRLRSLASLPPSCTASRIRLAHAGFYYDVSNTTRNPDNQHELVCFACGVTCGRWDTGESPAEIHRRLSPDCSVVKSLPDVSRTVQSEISKSDGVLYPTSTYVTSGVASNCSGGQMSTSLDSTSRACLMTSRIPRPQNYGVLDGSDSGDLTTDCAAIAPSSVSDEHHVTQAGPSYVTQRQTGRTFSADRPVLSMDVAVYPQFSTSQSRLATFRNWPSHFFRPQMLVSLGFFYAGYADCIRCFYCGVGLKTWEPGDDVTEEHIRWRSDCGFILATRGRQFVQNVLARLQLTLNEGNTDDQQRQSEPRGPGTFQSHGNGSGSTFSPLAFTTTASREPRGVNSEALQRVQAMGFPPELVARAGEDIEATGCQEVDTNYVVERIVELLHANDYTRDSRAAEESLELQSDGETPSERDSRLHQLRTENAKLKARRTCRTCKVRVVGMIFLPCGHVVNCVQCGNKARHCCTCHDVIRATANIFLS